MIDANMKITIKMVININSVPMSESMYLPKKNPSTSDKIISKKKLDATTINLTNFLFGIISFRKDDLLHLQVLAQYNYFHSAFRLKPLNKYPHLDDYLEEL